MRPGIPVADPADGAGERPGEGKQPRIDRDRAAQLPPGQADVLLRGEHREQVERLEDEADPPAAGRRDRPVRHAVRLGLRKEDPAGRRRVQSRNAVHQRRRAEPEGPMIAVNRPVATSTLTPSSARTAAVPLL